MTGLSLAAGGGGHSDKGGKEQNEQKEVGYLEDVGPEAEPFAAAAKSEPVEEPPPLPDFLEADAPEDLVCPLTL